MKESEKIEAFIKETEANIAKKEAEIAEAKGELKHFNAQLNAMKKLHANALENEKK